MALYMDRHDVPETVTAETVAHIHQEDLKLQDQFGCRVLTYWYDEKRKNAFCLIDAPNAAAIQELHNQAHGQIPNSIIEVNAGLVESFLGRIDDPHKLPDAELNIIDDSALRTIMIIRLNQSIPLPDYDVTFTSLLHQFNDAIIDLLNTHEGNVVKQTDTYFLVSFKFASNAVHAALAIYSIFKTTENNLNNGQIKCKIGLGAGVPVTEKKHIFEETIKLADRMCKYLQGNITVSAEAKELYTSENTTTLKEKENLFFLTPADEKFLTYLLDYTETHWSNTDLQIEDFSKPLGCSKSQLYRKITLLTGKSPHTFIIEYRLNEALRLLHKNESNVADIAYRTGFSSPSYFSKCFKKQYGHLPSNYLAVKTR